MSSKRTTSEDADAEPLTDGELRRWGDLRLLETYRRLSRDLRREGFDERTVHRMGRVEAELRERDLDPDAIAREIDAGRGRTDPAD